MKKKKDRLKSKYMDLDFNSMSDKEFNKISKKVYASIAVRGVGGMLLFIACIVGMVVCSRVGW